MRMPRLDATLVWRRAGRGLRCSSPSRICATISTGAAWKAASTDGALRSVDSVSGGRCAEFALGYQAIFPKGQPFLLFDEGYNRSIELRPETTSENIVSALHDTPRT
jgi:hypothetical protein